jgi:hypothetical protein
VGTEYFTDSTRFLHLRSFPSSYEKSTKYALEKIDFIVIKLLMIYKVSLFMYLKVKSLNHWQLYFVRIYEKEAQHTTYNLAKYNCQWLSDLTFRYIKNGSFLSVVLCGAIYNGYSVVLLAAEE